VVINGENRIQMLIGNFEAKLDQIREGPLYRLNSGKIGAGK